MPKAQPPQQPPPVMKLLVKYGKVGRSRFASHRDYARALERGLRRANVPMAYSSGFNPHQRVSYINPAPTGAESQAEYVVLGLRELVDPAVVCQGLNAAMPSGLPVLAVTESTGHEQFPASLWQVRLAGVDAAGWRDALARLDARNAEAELEGHDVVEPRPGSGEAPVVRLAVGENASGDGSSVIPPATSDRSVSAAGESVACSRLLVTRETKNGPRTFDVLAPLEFIGVGDDGDLILVIRHTEPLVRPDDIVTGLRSIAPDLSDDPSRLIRLAQGEVGAMVELARPLSE